MSKRVLFFCIITGLFWFSLYVYVPIVPTYAVNLGSSLSFVGVITGSYGLTQMLLRVPVGIVSDRLGKRKPFIVGGIFFAAVAGLSVCLIQSPGALLNCRLLGGVAAAAWVPFSVQFSMYFKPEEGPRAMGIINAVNSTGQVLAVILCGIMAGGGAVNVFRTAVIVGTVCLFLSIFISDAGATPESEPVSAVAIRMKDIIRVPLEPGLMLTSMLGLLSQYMTFATLYGFTPIVALNLHASDFQISFLLTLFILPAIFASALSGGIYARFGGRAALSAGFLLFALDCLLTPFAPNLPLLYSMTIMGGFAQGLVFPILMGYVVRLVSREKRSTAMGFYQAVYGLGMFLGPVVVGLFSDHAGIAWGFAATATAGLAAAAISQRMPR